MIKYDDLKENVIYVDDFAFKIAMKDGTVVLMSMDIHNPSHQSMTILGATENEARLNWGLNQQKILEQLKNGNEG